MNSIISIHAPRVGERLMRCLKISSSCLFQSTLPVWGSDWLADWTCCSPLYFNPRSPCGGATPSRFRPEPERRLFQSTLPVWGSDYSKSIRSAQARISIHAPRVGERLQRCTNFKVHLWQRGRIFAFLREERRDSHQAAALRDRFFDGNLGANLPAFSVYYGFAVRESRCPPANSCSCSQNAPPSFRTGYPGSKTAASPFRHP